MHSGNNKSVEAVREDLGIGMPITARTTRRGAALAALSLGIAMVQLDITIVNVGLEQMRGMMHGGVSGLQWVVNGYTLAYASLLLTGGALADRLGGRRMYLFGICLFTLSSLTCGLAPSGPILIASRVVQGIAAALMVPCSFVLLVHAYRDPSDKAKAIGVWGGVGGLAMAAGPIVGGVLISLFSWRSIFLINLPIGLLAIWLTLHFTVETEKSSKRSLDIPGQVLAATTLVAITAAIIEGGSLGWGDPEILAAFAVFMLAGTSFLMVESRVREPMMPLSFFRNPVFSTTAFIGFMLNVGFYGTIFLLSLYFQGPLGMSPLTAGLAFLPMMSIIGLNNFISGRITARWGNLLPIAGGLAISMTGLIGTAWVLGPTAGYRDFWLALLFISFGSSLIVAPMINASLATVERSSAGIASGVLNAVRQAGGAVGVAVFGIIGAGGASVGGIRQAMLIAAALFLLAFVAALVWIRPRGQKADVRK